METDTDIVLTWKYKTNHCLLIQHVSKHIICKKLINKKELLVIQVSGPVTVELNVNMHCEACVEQLKRKILQMRGTIFLY
ncbi:hypothetical protein JHK82_044424 [Glycine max]|uniref:HMA domain-containing protein n=2 Tax=Glycine subgen. Soja TaxID=1462606 RepID=K7MFZ7_SOYBN|nr:hypothetical protein JHK86_044775 [Glycine max]KAG4940749.1 hypothetical protein JHK87_044620 [Glycine soja]KAG4951522.1 hypothetical protein JHK85_045389 [Glycine max]KAG5099372.1 hypothetical protein JHK82_044424 [Glycine max]KAG5107975.1 hypothetical protein JHK84_044882 [Glycine max]